MAISAQTPDILGERQSGQDVRAQNGNSNGLFRVSLYFVELIFYNEVMYICNGSYGMSSCGKYREIFLWPGWTWQGAFFFYFLIVFPPLIFCHF